MTPVLPLRNIRIIDFTMGWAGPLATRHLADMGAEVIKIESCTHMDWWRGWENTPEMIATREYEKQPIFNITNRNKFGVAIDLTLPKGRDLALRLVEQADAVIENQATSVMKKLGLSYDDLKVVNKEIIMLSLPAFGVAGPWGGYRGYGSTVEHASGLPHLSGEPDGPPMQTHVAYGDACGGMNAGAALLVGLFHRKKTGKGQRIDISQVEGLHQLGVHGSIEQSLTGQAPKRMGSRHPVFVPHGIFACANPDSWLVVTVTNEEEWSALCEAIGRSDLRKDSSLSSWEGRQAQQAMIESAISSWTIRFTNKEGMQVLQAAGVPAAAVLRSTDLLSDEGLVEREFWKKIDRQLVGRKSHPLTPWMVNGERAEIRWPAPLLGQHNKQVLHEILGMSEQEILNLAKNKVIGEVPEFDS